MKLHEDLLRGDDAELQRLRAHQREALTASRHELVPSALNPEPAVICMYGGRYLPLGRRGTGPTGTAPLRVKPYALLHGLYTLTHISTHGDRLTLISG